MNNDFVFLRPVTHEGNNNDTGGKYGSISNETLIKSHKQQQIFISKFRQSLEPYSAISAVSICQHICIIHNNNSKN